MLKKIRIIAATAFFLLITFLFLDFTGTFRWLHVFAHIQFIPAVLALNIGILIVLALLTLLFGRIYCSVICPLGVAQDGVSNISGRRKGKKSRFGYAPAKSWLRYGVLGLFVVAMIAGISVIVSLLDPYAAYGRIAANFFAPLYRLGNNLLALFAEKADSYTFYATEVWIKSWLTFGITALTLIVVGVLAWRHGRTYCNTICPVGTLLGLLSKFSLFRLTFNEEKCNKCTLCERGCKASCINTATMDIDRSRCVACFNCIDKCKSGAMSYAPVNIGSKKKLSTPVNSPNDEKHTDGFSRRSMLSLLGAITVTSAIKAQQLQVDGGLAEIEDKKIPHRKTPIVPPGAISAQNMKSKCTACQLCVSACPNNVLRPSGKLATLMQPEMSFERGYCRPECVGCSRVCPTGAIKPITTAEKSAISIGHAVWITENCVVNTDELRCTACERHCPTNAITLVPIHPEEEDTPQQGASGRRPSVLKIPTINKELCIGCGACEYYCPARPFSAIYVEGNVRHHSI